MSIQLQHDRIIFVSLWTIGAVQLSLCSIERMTVVVRCYPYIGSFDVEILLVVHWCRNVHRPMSCHNAYRHMNADLVRPRQRLLVLQPLPAGRSLRSAVARAHLLREQVHSVANARRNFLPPSADAGPRPCDG